MKDYQFHEYANIFPMLGSEELEELRADIEQNGLVEPLVLYEEKILDGRNRATACAMLGIEPPTVEYTGNDPVAYVVSKNLKRRHLTASQRAMIADEVANMRQGERTDLEPSQKFGKVSQTDAAKQFHVSHTSVEQAHKVRTEAIPEVTEAVKAGKVPVSVAATLTEATPEQQRAVIAKDDKKAILAEARKIQSEVREKKRAEVIAKLEDIATKEVKAAQGLYDVVVIDPPWDMQKIERDVAPEQVEFDYPTMTEEELSEFAIPAAEDCHLWLWTTHKFLPAALRLLDAWGFKYVCNFVWHKNGGFQPFGLPQYNCEFAIYARKGSPQFVDTKAFFTCFEANRTGHSEKPNEFYEVVRRVTVGRRIDIFNRREIEGFDTYGQEAK